MSSLNHRVAIIGFFLYALFSIFCVAPYASETEKPLRIAITDNYPPFSIVGPNGQTYGLFVDMWKLWSEATGIPVEFRASSWAETIEAVKNGDADIHSGLNKNNQRETFLDFSNPIHSARSALYFLRGEGKLLSLEELSGEKVGVLKGSFQESFLKEKYPDMITIAYDDTQQVTKALLDAKVRATLNETVALQTSLSRLGLNGALQGGQETVFNNLVYPGVKKGRNDLVDKINEGFKTIDVSKLIAAENRWLSDDNDHFYTQKGADLRLNAQEKEWLKKNPVTRISVMKNWPPYDHTDGEGRHFGLHSDLLELINEHLGTNFVVIPYEEWKDAYSTAASGENDGVLGLSWTKEREKTFLFSSAYYYTPAEVVMRIDVPPIKEWSGLNGKKIFMPAKTSLIAKVKAELPDATVIETFSKDEAMSRLANGEADAYLAWISASTQELRSMGLTITGQVDDRQGEVTLGVPVSKPLVASIVQKGLNSITQEEWATLKKRWTSTKNDADKQAQAMALTQDEINWLKKHKKIRFANELDWPPFDFAENGTPKGLTIDIVDLIAQKAGFEVEYVNGITWAELLEAFNKGEIDVLPALYWTEERAKTFSFTKPYAQNSTVLALHNDRKEINNLFDLKGKSVAVIKGFSTSDILKKAHPDITQVPVDNVQKGLELVSLGEVDAFFDSIGVISYVLDNNFIPNIRLSPDLGLADAAQTQLRMATSQSNSTLRNILQKGLDSLSKEELRTIKNRWLPLGNVEAEAVEEKVKFSDEEKAFIASKPKLTLGIDKAWAPFEFVEDGVYSGISSDVIKKISELSGLALTPKLEGTWDDVLTGAKNGTIDILPMLEATKERQEFLDFSKSYVSYPIVIMTRDDAPFISNLGGIGTLKTGVVSGYSIESDLMKDYPNIERIPQKDFESMLLNLSSGKIDVALSNLGVATYMIGKLNLNNLKVAAPTEYTNDLAMGIPKGNPILHSIIQKSLDAISEDEMTSIKNRWVALQVQFGLDFKTVAIYALPLLGGFIIIIGFIIMWNRKLGREVAERHEAEKQSRMLLEAVGEGIFGVDQKGYVTFINSVASQCLGFTSEQLIGQKVHALIHHTRPDGSHFPVEECPMWEAYTNGKISRIDSEVLWRQDGTSFPVEYNATPLRRNDEIVGAVISFRDITNVKEATKALHDHLGELERFNELAVDRELRMIELKQEINGLLKERGAEEKYEIVQ